MPSKAKFWVMNLRAEYTVILRGYYLMLTNSQMPHVLSIDGSQIAIGFDQMVFVIVAKCDCALNRALKNERCECA